MKYNSIDFFELKEILGIIKSENIKENLNFNFIKVLKGTKEPENSSVLYFPIYLNEEDDNGGWYPRSSDTRKHINDYIEEHPDYTYVLDLETFSQIKNKKIKVIIVKDIMESIDSLFNYVLKKRIFKTILVTGSVGKTTTAGLIENIIKDNVFRIYEKRITPIILKAYIITYLTPNIKYLVLEASLFYKHHVKYFSDLLKPYIGVCLNALSEHLGIDNINTVENVVICKTRIFEHSKYALINRNDKELKRLKFKNHKMFYGKYEMPSKVEYLYDISKIEEDIDFYVKTNLTKTEYGAAYYVGKIMRIPEDIIVNRLNNSAFVENRVNKKNLCGHEIIFDGDVSGVARFKTFTDHFYDRAILIIRYLTTSGEEYEDYSKFTECFSRFEKVYLFKDLEFLDVLKGPNVEIVENHDFIKKIEEGVQIFYHYGSFYRKYDEFNIDNLDRI